MTAPLAELDVVGDGDEVVVSLRGQIDLSNAQELEQEIAESVAGAREVTLELSRVEYLDSQGIRLLLGLSTRLTTRGASLVVVAPSDSVAGELLSLTRASDLFAVREAPG